MDPAVVAAWIAAGVSGLTLIGTLTAQYLGHRATNKQLERTFAEQHTRTLNERFATAAEQLGSDKPAVRLAGVHAMAALADDWEENRQVCVDVLCAYLRLPDEPDSSRDALEPQGQAFQANREVRHTVIRVIAARLRKDAATSWQGLDLDFTGVVFDGGDFSSVQFSSGTVSFREARFSGGTVSFREARFSGGTVDFTRARFSGGMISFHHARFTGGTVNFTGADFSDGTVEFTEATFSVSTIHFVRARFSGGTVNFTGADFSGGTVSFGAAQFSGGTVSFREARFSGSRVYFSGARFSGGTIWFTGAHFSRSEVNFSAYFSGGELSFTDARFSGGNASFGKAQFTGATVDFTGAQFSGGWVDFRYADDWSFPPIFSWTGTPPPVVHLPSGVA